MLSHFKCPWVASSTNGNGKQFLHYNLFLLNAGVNCSTLGSSTVTEDSPTEMRAMYRFALLLCKVGCLWSYGWDKSNIFYLYEFRAVFHTDSQSVFGDSCWPNDRMQIFGTYTLASFLKTESPSIFLYSLSNIYYILKKISKVMFASAFSSTNPVFFCYF